MKRHWLWLEDQPDTVADFKAIIERRITVSLVTTPAELIRQLLAIDASERDRIGLILDVMLINNPLLTCPPSWHGGEKAIYFQTKMGYDAGLVFYENFMLPTPRIPNQPFTPPPVVFLTVVHQDMRDVEVRCGKLKEQWAQVRGVETGEACVEWARKWDANGQGLLGILQRWEGEIP